MKGISDAAWFISLGLMLVLLGIGVGAKWAVGGTGLANIAATTVATITCAFGLAIFVRGVSKAWRE